MGRMWFAGLCVVAGVGVLAGWGWALLAAAAVLYATPVPGRVRSAARVLRSRTGDVAGRGWRWLRTGRHEVAVALMVVGMVLLPTSLSVQFGVTWGVAVLAVSVIGLALLLGWDSRPAP